MSNDQLEEKRRSGETGDDKEVKPRTAEIQTGHRRNKEEFPDTDAVPPPSNVCGFPC